MEYYYSTQPTIAWALNHYFYGGRHFVWAATPFYPYREPNPSSSNPYQMYAHLYHPWRDNDPFDRFIESIRLKLVVGVTATTGRLGADLASDLTEICLTCRVEAFYPVVYRLDRAALPEKRIDVDSGSAAIGSQEVLVRDLAENEFDILFGTDHRSALVNFISDPDRDPLDVLKILKEACE